MLRDEVQRRIDRLWDAFWSGGISNPLEVVEQITYLIFIRDLDHAQKVKEYRAAQIGGPIENPIYTEHTQHLRWSHFIKESPQEMLGTVRNGVFPWLRTLGGVESAYSHHIKDAHFTLTTPSLLARVVDMLDGIPPEERATMGDLYEYMLGRIATAGHNGQFRTPRHIIELIIEMMAPGPKEEICDPACGTAGFLVSAAEYVSRTHRDALLNPEQRRHFTENMFHGFDCDSTMLRIASMNMLLHEVEKADISYRNSLASDTIRDAGQYSLILADPPFAGNIDYDLISKDLLDIVQTKKTELLFIALALRLLKPGGRAAVIVPYGVLFGSSKAHIQLRRLLIEKYQIDAVVKLPSGVFKPYSGVSTAILFFTKMESDSTSSVWFYEIDADGWSLDDRRRPLMDGGKLGPIPSSTLTKIDHGKNNLPDVLARWSKRKGTERERKWSEQSFTVTKDELARHNYNLDLLHYRLTIEEGWRLGDFAEFFHGSVGENEAKMESSGRSSAGALQRVLYPSFLTSTLPEIAQLPVRTDPGQPGNRLCAGDIVGRGFGAVRWTVLPSEYDGVQAGRGLFVIRLVRSPVPSEYIAVYLNSPQADQFFRRYGISLNFRHDMPDIRIPECEGDFEEIRIAINKLKEGTDEADRIRHKLQRSKAKIFEKGTKNERRSRLEEAADLSSLIAENLRRQGEAYTVFQESYPYAIARAIRRFRHSSTLTERHEAAIQCAESLILSLGIVSLSFLAHWGQRQVDAVAEWYKHVERGGASLGHWIGVITAAGTFARKSGDQASGLAEATAAKKRGEGLMADLGKLVNQRNKIRHGAGPRTRAETERSLENFETLIFRSLSSSAFLGKIHWIYLDRLRWLPDIGKFGISGLALMGDHPDFRPIERQVEYPLADGALYMLTQRNDVIPLSPFCTLTDCPQCLAPELYYPDRFTDSTALLKSLDRGHELENESIFHNLRLWIES